MIQKFFDPLKYWKEDDGKWTVAAQGPLGNLDQDERPMVVCVQIFQDDADGTSQLIAECNGSDHEHAESFVPHDAPTKWVCPGHVKKGKEARNKRAVATALLVTSSDDGGFRTYTWTQSLRLEKSNPTPHS